jgi:hypothetical protein
MYGNTHNLAFVIRGTPQEVAIHVGTWSAANNGNVSSQEIHTWQRALQSALHSVYPAIELVAAQVEGVELDQLPLSGFALGIPTPKPIDSADGAFPLDRLIRVLADANWAYVVLAKPVEEMDISRQRNRVISEMRGSEAAVGAERGPSPLVKYYSELLTHVLKSLSSGAEVGFWRTGVYLLGDENSYHRLASVWRGIFSGDESLPEPVRVWDDAEAGKLAARWALPDVEDSDAPGQTLSRNPLQYQTLLTSSQLAAYIHLPRLETRGFRIESVPDFDVVPRSAKNKQKLVLGNVIERTRKTKTPYEIALRDLTRHAFVAGVTGSGKTNTIFHLLKQAANVNIHFMVLEPAKAEYRALLDEASLTNRLQIFTLGDEMTSPFRLNPFEVVAWPHVPVAVHLDLLRSVFSASFGMWTPLPQILERCLHEIYQDRGWDTTTNQNYRLDKNSEVADTFPTLSELYDKADKVIQSLGYEGRVVDDMRAALLTRINGLRVGGKGNMLDVQRSLPMKALLEAPTILELQGMGDDDDKAFVMGLLLIRLYEYRRAGNEFVGLKHLLVIEEAHRLLTNVAVKGEEEANPRAKAVESFANLLSEIRAYGQGVIVADQVPVKLAPDVIKNTNLKIAHRVVASDDREALAGAMAMNKRQTVALATLTRGQAAIFSVGDRDGDDAPVLVEIDQAKGKQEKEDGEDPADDERAGAEHLPDVDRVAKYMYSSPIRKQNRALFQEILTEEEMSDSKNYWTRDVARALADDAIVRRDFVRLVVSMTEDDTALDRLWNDLVVRAQGRRREGMNEMILLHCMIAYLSTWLARHRGSQNGWSYADTAELDKCLNAVLLAQLSRTNTIQALKSFRGVMHRLHARPFEPFPGCAEICTQNPTLCLYRRAVSDYIAGSKEDLVGTWIETLRNDDAQLRHTWQVSLPVAEELIEREKGQTPAIRRIRLCYEQHMLSRQFLEDRRSILKVLMDERLKAAGGGPEDA